MKAPEYKWIKLSFGVYVCVCAIISGKSWSSFGGYAISHFPTLSHLFHSLNQTSNGILRRQIRHIIRFHHFNAFIIISLEFPFGFLFFTHCLSLSISRIFLQRPGRCDNMNIKSIVRVFFHFLFTIVAIPCKWLLNFFGCIQCKTEMTMTTTMMMTMLIWWIYILNFEIVICNTTPVYIKWHAHAHRILFVMNLGVTRLATHSKIHFIYILIEIWNENKQTKTTTTTTTIKMNIQNYNFNSGGLSFLLLIFQLTVFCFISFLVSKFFVRLLNIGCVIRLCACVCICVVENLFTLLE